MQKTKTKTRENIGHGIPDAPDHWFHKMKRLSLSRHAHERRSAIVAPPSKANRSQHTTTSIPTPTLQQPVVRDTATNGTNHSEAPRPSVVEASRASDSAPVQDSSNTTDAQATGGPSLAPEAVSPNAEKTAAPSAEVTPTAPLEGNLQISNPSPKVADDRGRTTAIDDIAPVTQMSAAKQESKNLDHGPKQKQNVLNEPTSREYSQDQTERFAMRNVHQVLEYHLREYERVRVAICVDMEYHKGSRRVRVTCYDGAVDKARDIENALAKNGKSFHGLSYVVHCRKGTKILGYRGSDIDRIGAAAITSESSDNDTAKQPGTFEATTTHDGDMGGTSNRGGGVHTYNGNYYNTIHIGANMTHMGGGAHTYNGNYFNEQHRDCSDRCGQDFSNTPYWTRESTMVEIFCGDEKNGNITGAPIRMTTKRKDGTSAVSLWTCGGIIKVDGKDYGLTTAHPFVLSNSFPPQEMPPNEDADKVNDRFADYGPFGGKDDFFSAEEHPEKYWQVIGKVSYYALAKMGSIPSNNDWLLFELPTDRPMWNDYGDKKNWQDLEKRAESSTDALAVFTARGTLAAQILEGTTFMILGNSSFEVMKIGLREPLRPGDSGSWLMRGSELVGVMIAGSEEEPEWPIGYAISAHELFRSISASMGGLSVRPLTALENAINAKRQTGGSQQSLVLLRIRQLFDANAPVRRIKVLHDHHKLSSLASIQTGNAALTALLRLGFFCSAIMLTSPITRRSHLTLTPWWNGTERIGEMLHQQLSQFSEGLAVIRLILALSASLPRLEIRARARASECANALSVLLEELKISPVPAHAHLRALVVSVCNHYKPPKPLNVHYGGQRVTTSPIYLAASLARALYAIRTHNFFVNQGVTGKYLKKFIVAYTRYPAIAVDGKNVAGLVNDTPVINSIEPRIFLANLDSARVPQDTRWKGLFLGIVVEFDELEEALETYAAYWRAGQSPTRLVEYDFRVTG